MPPSIDADPYNALRFAGFRWLLAGTSLAFMAAQIQSLVLGWQVYELTHDPMSLGWIGLSEAIPFLGLSLFGGWAADRWDRRVLSMGATAVSLLGASLLLLLSHSSTNSTTWPFYAIQSLAGLSRALLRPASQALGTDLVPRHAYENAATWRSSCFQFSMVAGPALGGILFAWGGAALAYEVVAGLLVVSLMATFEVRDPKSQTKAPSSGVAGLIAGIHFVFSNRLILSALLLDLFAVLFGGAIALLPAFAHDILRIGPAGLGLMRTAPAVGAIVMAVVVAHRRPSERAGQTLLWSVAAFGLAWILFACSRNLYWSILLLALSGAFDNVSVILRATLVQTLTPGHMMGRVQAVNGLFIGSSNEIGAFESGLAARFLGIVPSVVVGGCMTLVVVGLMARMVPDLRRLKRITSASS
jgi:MFS family permease